MTARSWSLIILFCLIIFISGCTHESTETTTTTSIINAQQTFKGPAGDVKKYNGLWLPFMRETEMALNDIDELKTDGVNIAAIGVRLFASSEEMNWKFNNITEYEDEKKIKNAINEFHKNGIRTMLILNPAHGDFGVSPYPAENTGKELLEMLNPLVLKWAGVAEEYGAEIFCPVNEPSLLAGKDDISEWAQEILPEIKKDYHGKLAFRVQDEGDDYPVYNLEGYDYILPMATFCARKHIVNDSYENYVKSVARNNVEKLENFKKSYPNRTFILFEVSAFTGPDYYWWEPIAPENQKNSEHEWPDDFFMASNEEQAKCFEIFFNTSWNDTAGYLLNTAKGFEFMGKPAEAVVREWFNK